MDEKKKQPDQFSPGPWTARPLEFVCCHFVEGDRWAIDNASGVPIAAVEANDQPDWIVTLDETAANAHLMADAWEMRRLLKSLAEAHSRDWETIISEVSDFLSKSKVN